MRRSEATGSPVAARNELVEFRAQYAIHRYRFSDSTLSDFHVSGPGLRHGVFDVAEDDATAVVKSLRALIDAHVLRH
ncbi:MAG TPA: hypothetical protein VGC74_02435 [Stenotrophomonas sp.]|jgi:hypothetical protein